MRLTALFVAICILLIAGSSGAIALLAFGLDPTEAAWVAIGVLIGLSIYNFVSTRVNLHSMVGNQLSDLSYGTVDLGRQVAELGRRISALESKVEHDLERSRAAADPLDAEIGELGTLVKQLADTVSTHETLLFRPSRATSPLTAPPVVPRTPDKPPYEPAGPRQSKLDAPATKAAPTDLERRQANEELAASIKSAIEGNRVDLYLQPVVTLPQRKVRYYEAMSRLRTENGEVVAAADFVGLAEKGGLMPKVDNLVLFRCVQVIRRLLLKNRDIGLFCNLSGSTLTDPTEFQQLLEFLDANRAIAPSLVLEFTQAAIRAAGPIENESLAAMAERGFRFSLDNLTDLTLDARDLAGRGFRFIKIPASLLLNRAGSVTTDIHPADLSDLLGRFGIDLVAEKIESEGMVVDLLDYDVKFGQGFLFSAPRPVRAEALNGIGERNDVVARDTAPADEPAGRPAQPAAAASAAPAGQRVSLAQLGRGGGRI